MPIYEYECKNCACRFELKRSFVKDEESPCCPQCRGEVRQLFSPPAIIFKGSGFYVTDNRNDHNRPPGHGKIDKVESDKKEDGKALKIKNGRKEEGKADKIEGDKKEDGEALKVENGRKEEGKADKIQSSKKSESK